MQKMTAYRILYAVFLFVIFTLFGIQKLASSWFESDLRSLLPQTQQWSSVQMEADYRQEQQLNRQIIALVGHADAKLAFSIATEISSQWQESGLFEQIYSKTEPNLAQFKAEIQLLKWAVLPKEIKSQLLDTPQTYFQAYAEQIVNPFKQNQLVSFEQDWLGVGRFVIPQAQQLSNMRWNAENGMIFTENQSKTWVMLRAELKQSDLLNTEQSLPSLLAENRRYATALQAELNVTGTSLFAMVAKQQAESESTFMSSLGVSLTLILLIAVFRSWRVLSLFIPILIGMGAGIAVTVFLLGKIHLLTLVIGTSLVGVLIDFPLHWLASSLSVRNWQAEQAMKDHQFTFFISLMVTLLGYGLLWFTDLPILKQTALFSAVALVAAIIATILFLPPMFVRVDFSRRPRFPIDNIKLPMLLKHKGIKILFCLLVITGVFRSEWQDDIRQWVALPHGMLQEAQKISELTGIDLGSQYFLIVADNDEQLLAKTELLSQRLTTLGQSHQALSQWLSSEQEQQQFKLQLSAKIQPLAYQPLIELGVESEEIIQSIHQLQRQSPVSLQQALNTKLGQGWKTLYLGKLSSNQVATLIKIKQMQSAEHLSALANNKDIFWQDKRAYLNQAFQQTRNDAAWLKGVSFLLAGLVLWCLFGRKAAVQILVPPIIAIVTTVAIFGWLALPITLFTMFGLLLVSAIGIDYTAYMQHSAENLATKITAILLAATTTMISFCLLAFSATPAVASFGLSVSIGLGICVCIIFSRKYIF
ncbi:MMPL family transporter [Actinobacillus suis]|uniref:MMPL family transporter n=1 Tax=Actinobacillus suis TaxID=716 RepID=UPI0004E7E0B3|nr:membrane protein [Actinobacillus suis]AIJ32218.1 hypothetical protein ASU1_09815 [Actinobacillus suis ATCC 33415]